MRFACCLFVGVALLVIALIGLRWWHRPAPTAAPPQTVLVIAGDEALVRRLQAKTDVIRRLIDGELTLFEAAAWLRYIDRTTASAGAAPAPQEDDKAEAERYCRLAITWAGPAAAQEESAAVVSRLEAELAERLRSNGRVELPEVP